MGYIGGKYLLVIIEKLRNEKFMLMATPSESSYRLRTSHSQNPVFLETIDRTRCRGIAATEAVHELLSLKLVWEFTIAFIVASSAAAYHKLLVLGQRIIPVGRGVGATSSSSCTDWPHFILD